MRKKKTNKPKSASRDETTGAPKRAPVNPRPRRWRWPIVGSTLLLLSFVIFAASWIGLFNVGLQLDDRLRNFVVAHIDSTIKKRFDYEEVALIMIDRNEQSRPPFGKPDSSHRHYHAGLLEALAGKAKVVVFDIDFSEPAQNPKDDVEFAAAIEQAERAGTRVMVGAVLFKGESQAKFAEPLRTALKDRWGILSGGKFGSTNVSAVHLGLRSPNQPTPNSETAEQLLIPSLALKAFMALRYPNESLQAFFNPFTNIVHLRRGGANGAITDSIPVSDDDASFTFELAGKDEEGRNNLYHDVYANRANVSEFNNKIVVIGYQAGDEQDVGKSEKRYGAEIQANAISNLLLHIFIHRLSPGYQYLLIVLMILVGAVARFKLGWLANYTLPVKLPGGMIDRKVEVPTVLLVFVMLYLFIAFLAYRLDRALLGVTYDLAALFLSYLSIGLVRARLGFE